LQFTVGDFNPDLVRLRNLVWSLKSRGPWELVTWALGTLPTGLKLPGHKAENLPVYAAKMKFVWNCAYSIS